MINKEIYDKAEKLVSSINDAVLTSINENGYPRSCFLGIMAHDNPWTLYFSTGSNGVKAKHFANNNKASVAYADVAKNNGVTLIGNAEIIDDLAFKEKTWSDWMYEYFPGGPSDKDYCLIKFTADEVTYWIDHEFGTEKVK